MLLAKFIAFPCLFHKFCVKFSKIFNYDVIHENATSSRSINFFLELSLAQPALIGCIHAPTTLSGCTKNPTTLDCEQ